jgi:nitrogen fixation protein NifU and related proteins
MDWLTIVIGGGVLVVMAVLWFIICYFLTPHLNQPDGKARITGTCGDTMEICLEFEKDKVVNCSYWTSGCASSLNCVCAAADFAMGKSPEEILDIDGDVIRESIGGLPQEYMHCADLAAETLHAAVDDYMKSVVAH